MNQIYPILLLSVLAVLFACEPQDKPVDPTPAEPEDRIRYEALLDDTIQAYMSREQIPGLAVSVIREGQIDWMRGYGYANVVAKTAVSKNTRFTVGDPETSLGDFLRGYLAAYLAKRIEGISFEQYCRVHVFAELGLFNISWLLSGMQTQTLAIPYEKVGPSLQPQAFYSYPFYPAGTLRISIERLSRFWLNMIESGICGPQQLITPASLERMYPVQYPDASTAQAMAWTYRSLEGRTLLGLDGTDVGLSTRMKMDPQARRGVILLSNERGYDAALDRILLRVFEAAEIR